ncbi:MAG: DUF4394 domain-containing protein [Candidatus Cloacimonetes bacterium]|nr:DUF4394 domain-containing protein [Candidatus Cloacimonadota bacterium]MDY0367388.1 DUF4394 domain-containing protein [Candidatus Syntrophosphaera sp.]
MKKFTLSLLIAWGLACVLGATTVTIGTYAGYNSSTSYPSPYANTDVVDHEQYLITAAEMEAAGAGFGQIQAISFYVQEVNGCAALPRYTIKIGSTPDEQLTDYIPDEDLSTVFYSNPYQVVAGWNEHVFSDPWIWDGSSNLVVDVGYRIMNTTSANASVHYADTSPSYRCLYQDGLSHTQSLLRPIMKLEMADIQLEIGGVETEDNLLPMSGLHNYSYSQCLYLQSEIDISGLYITRIAYFWNGAAANANSTNWTVYMGHKAGNVFSSTSDWLPLAQLSQVFEGIVRLPASPGWVEIILDTPFAYDNVNNLVIAVDENSPGNDNPSGLFRNTVSDFRGLIAVSANDIDPAGPGSSVSSSRFADVILAFLPEPLGSPAPPLPVFPPEGYSQVDYAGLDLSWGPNAQGGLPDSYTLYLANDPGQIFAQQSFPGLTANHFNPVAQGGMSFVYGQQWHWAVRAVNTEGNAVFTPPLSFSVLPYPAAVPPAEQHFNGPDFPVGWSQAQSGGMTQDCWEVSNTNYAGGSAYEMKFTAPYGQTGISRLISQPVSTGSGSGFMVSFRYRVQTTQPGFSFSLQYSHDLQNWQNPLWQFDPQNDPLSGTVTVFVSPLSWPYTFLGFTLAGSFSSSIYCAIDDLILSPSLDHDVGVGKILQVNGVVEPEAVFAGARIFNYGNNAQSFDVFMRSGVRFTDTQTVTDLAPGAFVDVYFDPFIPVAGEVNQIEVQTVLTGDEDTDNDVMFLDFACVYLDVPALANVALDPAGQLSGPAGFNLERPSQVNDLPGAAVAPSYISGGCWVNGQWWFLQDYSHNLWKVDPVTGNASIIGNTGQWNMKGLSQAGPGQTIYACTEDRLYTLNPISGYATAVGGYFGIGGGMACLATDSADNTLYGININTDMLYTINTSTGSATQVGPLGFELNYSTLDCAFDQDNGSLFLATPDFTSALFWIDTASGKAYKVGNFPSGTQMTGFALPFGPPEAPVAFIAEGGNLNWEPVYRASSYKVYGSATPDGGFSLLDTTTDTNWSDPTFPQSRRFYRVTASN